MLFFSPQTGSGDQLRIDGGRREALIEQTHLYDGQITLEFNPGRHTYVVVNKGRRYKVPSVTAVCGIIAKPALVGWAANTAVDVCKGAIAPGVEYAESYLDAVWTAARGANRELKTEAASRGTDIHRGLQQQIEETHCLPSGSEWGRLSGLQVEACERRIYSRRKRFSGTLDALVLDSESLLLVDWKTSKAIYPEFRLQTAAYQAAWEEEHPDQPIQGRYLVRISDEGIEPHYYPRETFRRDFAAFLGALDLYKRLQQIERETRKKAQNSCNKTSLLEV